MTIANADTRALCRLARARGVQAGTLQTAIERAGSLDTLLKLDAAALRHCGLRPASAQALAHPDARQLDCDLQIIERLGIVLLAAHLPGYPAQLLQIQNAPAVLFVRGDASVLERTQLAMVGSRNPTAAGVQIARDFAFHFASLGLVITSGLALGIDAASHEGALAAQGLTLAVCGTGVDRLYPEQHAELAERILERGALVSEFPPGTPPLPGHFPQRNRLISGLSCGVLVVEAARRSGSLATARLAGEQGREVFAVPGSIHSPLSHGCHQLLREGAKLVESAEDILTEIHLPDESPFEKQKLMTRPELLELPLEDPPRLRNPTEILLDALGFDPTGIDALCARTALPSAAVVPLLLQLELEGRVTVDATGRYHRTSR